MKDAARAKKPKRPVRDDLEIEVVGIDVKPAPDAQSRLRRLFSILVKLAEDDIPTRVTEPSPDGDVEAEG